MLQICEDVQLFRTLSVLFYEFSYSSTYSANWPIVLLIVLPTVSLRVSSLLDLLV